MKSISKISLGLAALFVMPLVGGVAHAADEGFFAEIGVGYSKMDVPAAPAGVAVDDTSTAFSIGGGYNFNNMFALEAGYTDLGEVTASGAGLSATVSVDGWYVGPRLTFALNNQAEVYGRIGILAWDAETKSNFGFSGSDDGTDVYFGLGAAWKFNDKVSLGAEWTRYKFEDAGGDTDVDVIGAKLKFNF